MLLIMARLGLHTAEVIAIQLDDIDWRAGELLVRGKGKRHDRVPISAEVGEALSRYLREERGPTSCRALSITHRAPHRAFKDGQIVNAFPLSTAVRPHRRCSSRGCRTSVSARSAPWAGFF
jgi:integrase